MAWGKVDDKLHSTVKWRRASKGARALWTTALSWCSDQENDGQVPADMLRTLDGTKGEATSLVNAGLWDEVPDGGWVFHDWQDYNPDGASKKAKREAESKGGRRGAHTRWHEKEGVRVPGCEWCERGTNVDTSTSAGPLTNQTSNIGGSATRSTNNGKSRVRPGDESAPNGLPNGVPHGVVMGEGQWGANAPDPTRTQPLSDTHLSSSGGTYVTRDTEPPPPARTTTKALEHAGLAPWEEDDFLIHLTASGTRNTTALITALDRKGELQDRIKEWRDEDNRKSRMPRVITPNITKTKRGPDGSPVTELCEHDFEVGRCPKCRAEGVAS